MALTLSYFLVEGSWLKNQSLVEESVADLIACDPPSGYDLGLIGCDLPSGYDLDLIGCDLPSGYDLDLVWIQIWF